MFEDQRGNWKRAFIVKFGALLTMWLLSSWLAADLSLKSRTLDAIRDESSALGKEIDSTAGAVDRGLDFLHGIPALVAKDDRIAAALAHLGGTRPSSMPAGRRGTTWSDDPMLAAVDGYLSQVGAFLGADVVWVTNAAGDCIASSNFREAESFIGTNYADRDYFRAAQNGKHGQQYAMGRKTNIPGLYFSAPISLGGRFAGVAVAKIDLPKLSHWVNQTDAFISDEYGVIIVARDPALEMRALPDAAVARLSAAERLARYKRSDFPPLAIAPWGDQRFPWLHHFDRESQPLLISSRHLADEVLDVHAFKRLPFVAAFERERLKLFVLIGMSGTLVLSVAAGLVLFSRIRRRAAASAAESASLLRAAIESTVDGILAVDNDRRITACNQRFFDIWHIPPDLIASGRDEEMLNYVHAQVDDPQAFVDKVMDLYAHPESSSFDEVRFKDGTAVERYSSPQRLGERIVGRVWSFRDVTERKRAEQAIQDSHGELESKVRERTAALRSANLTLQAEKSLQEELNRQLAQAHGQLLQSEKMAAIGQLAAGVAHEINNPVGFVSSNLTTLRRYVADLLKLINCYERGEEEMREATRAGIDELKRKVDLDYLREDFEILMSESIDGMQRVKRIVEDLKDFAHVSEAVTQLTNIERGLDSTLNVVWNELKYKAEVVKEYGGVPEIECISSQLNQVFMNLLVNAAQAIEDRGRITIRTGREGQYVWVEVEDTGRGIPPEDLDRIFDPFFTTKPVGKGTGLGLSLSYGIVQKHHGRFEVRSEVGKGSVFRVWLPMTQPSTP